MTNLLKNVVSLVSCVLIYSCASPIDFQKDSLGENQNKVDSSNVTLPDFKNEPTEKDIEKLTKRSFSTKSVSGNLYANFSTIGLYYTPNLIQYLWGKNFENGRYYKIKLTSNSNQTVYGRLYKKINGNWYKDRWISSNDDITFQGGKTDFSEIYIDFFCSEKATSGFAYIEELAKASITKEELGRILLKNNYNGITQDYLAYYNVKNGYHPGIDYRASVGKAIYSPVSGQVTTNMDSFGQVAIKINGGSKRFIFMHLSSSNVKSGAWVNAGDLVGYSGETGAKGQPHLHVELRDGRDGGANYFSSLNSIGVNDNPINFNK